LRLIQLINIFIESGDTSLAYKLINTLTNKYLYINNGNLSKLFILELYNSMNNFKKFNFSEIFLNILYMNNYIPNNDDNFEFFEILYLIIDKMKYNELLSILTSLKKDIFLSKITTIEISARVLDFKIEKIIKNNDSNEIDMIKEKLDELLDIFINLDNYNKLKISDDNEKTLEILLQELLSIILQLTILNDKEYIKYFENFITFIKAKGKDENLVIRIFKTIFFQLYENDKDINNNTIINFYKTKIKYYENGTNLELFVPKKMDNYLFKYLSELTNFIVKFETNEDIIKDILEYFEKSINLYCNFINGYNKNFDYILCNLTHIFNSKQIMNNIFEYLKLLFSKKDLPELSKSFKSIIIFQFHHCQNPAYFGIIKQIFCDTKNYSNYFPFINNIIDFISKESDKMNNIKGNINNSNNNFYNNSIEVLKIFFLSIKNNTKLLSDKNFTDLFIKYFEFLKRNKLLLSKYLILIFFKEKNKLYQKTIIEICSNIFISLNKNDNENYLKKYFCENDEKSLIFIIDSINKNLSYNKKEKFNIYTNDSLNKFLKNNGCKEEENSLLIILLDKIYKYKIQNEKQDKKIYNDKQLDIYLKFILEELFIFLNNCGKWKKINKNKQIEEEIKLILSLKDNNDYEIIIKKILDYKLQNEGDKYKKLENEEKINEKGKTEESNDNNNKFLDDCPLKKNCLLLKVNNNIQKEKNIINNNMNESPKILGNFLDVESDNNILCLKRDLLLKQCSIYFSDIYFNDKNFSTLKKYFAYEIENKNKINKDIDKFKYPTILKNYSNNLFAYPNIFYRTYTSFYDGETLKISHPYFHKESIKKCSFPLLLSHYYSLNNFYDDYEISYFKKECEVIMKTNIICGNLNLKKNIIVFISDYKIKEKYQKSLEYLFCSIKDDIKDKNKIIIIKYKDIKEIIARRYIYGYRAFEIFLKNGKSYYFNLYSEENLSKLFKVMEKLVINKKYNFEIIKEPLKYFNQKKYNEEWEKDKISTYQYLLYVNKFSSRSFNDINQYPVFPWIFLDTKNIKDCNFPKFRNMEHPISILSDDDLDETKIFFLSNKEENPKFPYHFRLHYSTCGYLLNYLARVSPFTEEQIHFQGGQFDNPNRQIHKIEEILKVLSSSRDNRELVPEYFTSIEFFLNVNYNYFGKRSSDNEVLNDIVYQKNCFNSLSQYIYYNRLLLNYRPNIDDIKTCDKKDENNLPEKLKNLIDNLKIDLWINLIFGVNQWDKKPNQNKLNLFNKYSYKQNIDFHSILERYKKKNLKENIIINKILSKKSRIINFGQCPEVLFNRKHQDNILPLKTNEEDGNDIIEVTNYNKIEIRNKKVITFWISENDNYIYFLVFNDNIERNEQSILIFENNMMEQKNPKYILDIKEIMIFKSKKSLKNKSIFTNSRATSEISSNIISNNSNNNDLRLKGKEDDDFSFEIIENPKNNTDKKKENKNDYQYYYKISPKYALFDICLDNFIYFFIGRNMDNSIKIYEQNTSCTTKYELKYNLFTDSFVSCIYLKDKYSFFSGHKNGKLYEWSIIYPSDNNQSNRRMSKTKKNNNFTSIKKIELDRDIFAHKDSMICSILYIEKHNIIITTSYDGKLYIRKYLDFELLSIIKTKNESIIISRVVYTDYDLLYCLLNFKDKELQYGSGINIYSLNGLLLESSEINNIVVDIEPLKNGKIICNNLNSRKLFIFGFNQNKGQLIEENILQYFKNDNILNNKIISFIFQKKNNYFFILLDNGELLKTSNSTFSLLFKGAHKLENIINSNTKKINKDPRQSSSKKLSNNY